MPYPTNTYPTGLQDTTNPTATDTVATFDHAGLEAFQNDSIEALKTKVGIDGSAVTTTHDYKLNGVIGSDKAVSRTGSETLTNKTLTSPSITNKTSTGTDNGTETLVNKTLTSPTITTPTISSTGFTNAQHAHTGATSGGQLSESALALTDVTTNNASITQHGFMQKYPNNTSTYLRGDGTFATISNTTKFGGTGADDALTVSSGTTNINLSSAQVVVKNYTSISITGTGAVTFTNPHANGTIIILKSQGNVTLTSSASPNIDVRLMGSDGGLSNQIASSTGRGGKGGGALYIECAGALNYTGSINASGANGTTNTGSARLGNNGGGAGGMVVILYGSLTANSGTTTVSAGSAAGAIGGGNAGTEGNNGTISYGIHGQFAAGTGGGATNTTVSTIFGVTPSLLTLTSSKYIPLMPGSGGGGGSGGFGGGATIDGGTGVGMGTSGNGVTIIGDNTAFQ